MEAILDNFGPKNNFWKYNPQFLAFKDFADFHAADKSKGKELSSRIMWGIAFYAHPSSILANLNSADKQDLINSDYIRDKNFQWESVEELVAAFSSLVVTKARRSLDQWEAKMQERDQFISETKYTLENAHTFDTVLKNTASLWAQYKLIKEDVLKMGNTVISKGGSKPSLSDEGRI